MSTDNYHYTRPLVASFMEFRPKINMLVRRNLFVRIEGRYFWHLRSIQKGKTLILDPIHGTNKGGPRLTAK